MRTTAADATGTISTTFDVPLGKAPSTYTVKAMDVATTNNATAPFTVPTPTITLDPTWGPPGRSIGITGANFTWTGVVGIYFDTTFIGNVTAVNGAITYTFTVPAGKTPGTYTVKAKDWGTGYEATKPFTVPVPTITLSVDWGPPGKSIDISGANFTWTGTNIIRVYFDTTSVLNATTTDGAFSGAFSVPSVLPGTYTVNATDIETGYSVTKSFTVPPPTITLDPDGGPPDTPVAVTGGNFTFNGAVRIYFDTTSVLNVTATGTGDISGTFTVPSVPIGSYTVKALDVATGYYATAPFTVGPRLDPISPTSGPPATNVTVTGSGFTINQTVQIYFDTTFIKNVTATPIGEISTWFLVPDVSSGTYNVTAYDVVTDTWTPPKTFTIPPTSITLDPTTGLVGANITITGSNFKINATVAISFDATWIKDVTADGDGAIESWFLVPSVLPGPHTVTATDDINPATASFYVLGTGGIEDVIDMLVDIEGKLDDVTRWVSDADLASAVSTITSAISDAKSDILLAISGLDAKLGTFTAPDTVASLLYDIKAAVVAIDISGIELKLDGIKGKLDLLVVDADLSGVPDFIEEIDAIEVKLDVIGPKIDDILADTAAIDWADIVAIKTEVLAIEGKLDEIKVAIAPPEVIEGKKICPTGGSVVLFSVDKTEMAGRYKVSFTIDATELDSYDYLYVNVYVKATADSSLVLAKQVRITGRTGVYPQEVYIDSLVNAEHVKVELVWYRGTTSDDNIHYQAVISSP